MMAENTGGVMPQMLHQAALEAGLPGTIPIIPAGGVLHDHSRVDPDARGKVPGEYYNGAWDGLGSWPDYQMTKELAVRWDQLRANVGCKMGIDVAALDIDVTDQLLAKAMADYIHTLSEGTWPIRIGQAPKSMYLFRVKGAPIRRRQYGFKMDGADKQLIDVLGISSKGRPTQGVLFGTHPSGKTYDWNVPVYYDQLPWISQEEMDALIDALSTIAKGRGWSRGNSHAVAGGADNDGTGSHLGPQPVDQSLVAPVVELIPNDDLNYEDWIGVGYAIKASLGAAGWETFATWSAKAPKDDPKFTKTAWAGIKPDGSTGMGRLVFLAKRACGGMLPGDLDQRVKEGIMAKSREASGMPDVAPEIAQGMVHAVQSPQPTQGVVPVVARPWIDLTQDDKGNAHCNMANVAAYLNNSDLWSQCFAFDTFNQQPVVLHPLPGSGDKRTPRRLEDGDYRIAHQWFQRYMWHNTKKTDVIDAIELTCHENAFEPVQEYLRSVAWDGTKRLDTWLFEYAGVETAMRPYVTAVARKWLISAVARAMDPGCQADHSLILEGDQGAGKSTLLRSLMPDPEWFGDGLPDFHSKDAISYLNGKWIVEMSELTTVIKAEVEDMRRFLTRRVEDYRPSYGRTEIKRPRRVVFCGSTNRDDYLKDTQGERRFWIVFCQNPLDPVGLAAVRDQLWAEAMVAYQSGEQWWLDEEVANMARQQQIERVSEDPWMDMVQHQIGHLPEVSIPQVMLLLGMDLQARSKLAQARIRQCLEQLGYRKSGRFRDGRIRYQKG